MQKHMLRLEENCKVHLANQYLVIRERKHSYAIAKLCVASRGGTSKQFLKVVTTLKKSMLECSRPNQKGSGHPDSNLLFVKENALNILRLVTEFENSQKPRKRVVTSSLEHEIKNKKTRRDVPPGVVSHSS